MSEEEKSQEIKKKEIKNYYKVGLTVFLTFVCCILFFFMILRFEGFAEVWNKAIKGGQPIIIGLVLAYLMTPTVRVCEKKFKEWAQKIAKKKNKQLDEVKLGKRCRGLGVFCAVIFLLLIISLLIAAIVPALVQSITTLVKTLPDQVDTFMNTLEEAQIGDSKVLDLLGTTLTDIVDYLEKWWNKTIMPEINTYIAEITSGVISVLKGLMNFIIGIIVAVYVLTIQETLLAQSRKIIFAIFKPKQGNVIVHVIRHSSKIFGGFISGKLLDSAIIGMICYVGCLIMHMPNAVLVSVIVGVTNIIPFFGPFIGAVPSLFLVVIQSPWHALYLLIFIIVLQQVDGNIIGPKILGDSTGLSSFWVMFAILVFGGLWGFFGMLLGVPIFAVIYYIVGKLVNYGLRRRKLPTETKDYYRARGVYEDTNTLRYPEDPVDTPLRKEENTTEKGH